MTKTPFALTSAIALAAALAAGSALAQYGTGSQSTQSQAGNTMGQSSRSQPESAMGQTSQMQGGQQGTIGANNEIAQWAQGKHVSDLTGQSLYDNSGNDKIGEITSVVRAKRSNQPFAVVSAQGGILGLGGKRS
jgi:hypothetical protein